MIQQKLLSIKFERSDEEVTPRSGLMLFDEFIKAFGLSRKLAGDMPLPGSNRGFEAYTLWFDPRVIDSDKREAVMGPLVGLGRMGLTVRW